MWFWKNKKKNKGKNKEKTTNDYVQDFLTAKDKNDPEKMKESLLKAKEICPNNNSHCLTEVFCPECPFGGMVL